MMQEVETTEALEIEGGQNWECYLGRVGAVVIGAGVGGLGGAIVGALLWEAVGDSMGC